MGTDAAPAAARPAPRGFTLLEVSVAFVIMATLIAFIVEVWFSSMENASRAADNREIREVADTVFGRILFEHQVGKFHDGDSGTLDVLYGTWARLSSRDRERYERYEYQLEIKKVQAAGEIEEGSDAESLAGSQGTSTSTSSGSSGSSSTTPSSSEEDLPGVDLERITLRIRYKPEYRLGEAESGDLIVLSRLMPEPPDLGGGSGSSGGSGQ